MCEYIRAATHRRYHSILDGTRHQERRAIIQNLLQQAKDLSSPFAPAEAEIPLRSS
jgi:hypothetical protein